MRRLTKAGVACPSLGPFSSRSSRSKRTGARAFGRGKRHPRARCWSQSCPLCSPAAPRRGSRAAQCGGTFDSRYSMVLRASECHDCTSSCSSSDSHRSSIISIGLGIATGPRRAGSERDAASGRLHAFDAAAAERLVTHVGKSIRNLRTDNRSPARRKSRNRTPPTATENQRLPPQCSWSGQGARREPCRLRLRIQRVEVAVAGFGIDDRPDMTLRHRRRRREAGHRLFHAHAAGRITVIPIRRALDRAGCRSQAWRGRWWSRPPKTAPRRRRGGQRSTHRFTWKVHLTERGAAEGQHQRTRTAEGKRPGRRQWFIAALHSWRGSSGAPWDEGSIVIRTGPRLA